MQRYEDRRMRIVMRGIKIGKKKGGGSGGMAIFEFKDKAAEKEKEQATIEEASYRANLADEEIGL